MAPHVEDMIDKQRRWWFARLDEEKTSQGSRTEPPRRSKYLTEAQRRRLEERKEAALGRMHGWAYVSGKTVQYQPRDTLEHHYQQGFKEGLADAGEWITGMWGLAEMLGEIVRKVRNALADFLKAPDIPKPWDIEFFPRLPGVGGSVERGTRPSRSHKLGLDREQHVADVVGGKRTPNFEVLTKHGRTQIDVVGPNGEYIHVGGGAKAKSLGDFGKQMQRLKEAAEADRVKAQFWYDKGTPRKVVEIAQRWLGKENVIPFTLPNQPGGLR